jgi:soluble lytic murein transglycosylase-like protein
MAVLNIKIPATERSYYSNAEYEQMKTKVAGIINTYKDIIWNVARLTNLPTEIIISLIWIESNGKENAISPAGAIGLMQLTLNTPTDMVYLENKKGRLTDEEKTIIRKYIGNRLDTILKMKYYNQYGIQFTQADLKKPELNILLGSIVFGLIMDEETYNGQVRLDRAIIRYNRSYLTKIQPGSLADVLYIYSGETSNYILKFIGKNGVLSLLTA